MSRTKAIAVHGAQSVASQQLSQARRRLRTAHCAISNKAITEARSEVSLAIEDCNEAIEQMLLMLSELDYDTNGGDA